MRSTLVVALLVLLSPACTKREHGTDKTAAKPVDAIKLPVDPATTAPTEVAKPTPTPAAAAVAPFAYLGKQGAEVAVPEGCFTNVGADSAWNVMVGLDPSKPCTYDSEDGYSISFDVPTGPAKAAGKKPLPQVGATAETQVELAGKVLAATVTVVGHEAPYVVVDLEPKDRTAPARFGGIMKLRLDHDVEFMADLTSW